VRSRKNLFKEQNEFSIVTMLLDPLFSNIKNSLTNLQFFSLYLYVVILHNVYVPHP
jgi:hypothetical protein